MEPRVGIAHIEVRAADGTFSIGGETFPGLRAVRTTRRAGPSEDFALAFDDRA